MRHGGQWELCATRPHPLGQEAAHHGEQWKSITEGSASSNSRNQALGGKRHLLPSTPGTWCHLGSQWEAKIQGPARARYYCVKIFIGRRTFESFLLLFISNPSIGCSFTILFAIQQKAIIIFNIFHTFMKIYVWKMHS